MAVDAGEEEIVPLAKELLDASEDRGAVDIVNVESHDSDGVGTFLAQGAGKEVGLVVEFADGSEDAVPGMWRDVLGRWGVVDDRGNRAWRKLDVLGDRFQSDRTLGSRATLFARPHYF